MKMANLAQTINVLQALILTDKEKMLLTPTYYVFDLYKAHQDATLIPLSIQSKDYVLGSEKLPAINGSGSIDKNGTITLTLVNIDPANSQEITLDLADAQSLKVSGQVITASKYTDHNTFDKPGTVKPQPFDGAKKSKSGLTITLPAKSVVALTLTK